MQSSEPHTHQLSRFSSLAFVACSLAFALAVVSGCGEEKQVEKTPASPPSATVDVNDPGNRIDATFQSVDPE